MAFLKESRIITAAIDGSRMEIISELDTDTGKINVTFINPSNPRERVTQTIEEAIDGEEKKQKKTNLAPGMRELSEDMLSTIKEQQQALLSSSQEQKTKDTKTETSEETTTQNRDSDDKGRIVQANSQRFDDGSSRTEFGNGEVSTTDTSNVVSYQKSSATNNLGTGVGLPGARPHNPLSEFISYNYQLSLYLATPEGLNNFYEFGRTGLDVSPSGKGGFLLVAQTGGKSGDVVPGLELDVTIDNLSIKQANAGQATGSTLGTQEIFFDLFEPHSISFLTRLKIAEKKLKESSTILKGMDENNNYLNHFFVLGIRFYGYDSSGKIITGDRYTSSDQSRQDKFAIFERYFPLKIQEFKSKFGASINTYKVKAAPVSMLSGQGMRSRVLKDMHISGSTVKELLDELMTQQTKRESKTPGIEIPASYSVIFPEDSKIIGEASVVNSAVDKDKSRSSTPAANNSNESTEKAAATTILNKKVKKLALKNDTSLIQAIEIIIAHSSYIEDSLAQIKKSEVELSKENPEEDYIKNSSTKTFEWFYVNPIPRILGYDKKINQWVYHIDYVVTRYQIAYLPSPYIKNLNKALGAFKRYDYMYTGTSNEILSYEQEMDMTYFVLGTSTSGVPALPNRVSNTERTSELGLGAEDIDNIRTIFADPGSFKSAKITILGDPDYLSQTENKTNILQAKLKQPSVPLDTVTSTFLSSSGQMLVEIRFRDVQDHDLSTGLMKRNDNIQFIPQLLRNDPETKKEKKETGTFYTPTTIYSYFRGGKFSQELTLVVTDYDMNTDNNQKPASELSQREESENQSNTETARSGRQNPVEDQSNAETARLQRYQDSADDDKGTIYDKTGYYAKKQRIEGSIYDKAARERSGWGESISNWIGSKTNQPTPTINQPGEVNSKTLLPKRN